MILAAGDTGSAGPLGLLVVLLLFVATVLLIRNMNARLKRLPTSFDPADPVKGPPGDSPKITPEGPPSDGSASGPTAGA